MDEGFRRAHRPGGGCGNTPMGLRRLLVYPLPIAPWRGLPPESTDARVARLWEIASRSGVSVGVFNWLNTTPAVPMRGFLHGAGSAEPSNYPEDLAADLPAVRTPENDDPNHDLLDEYFVYEQALYDRFAQLAVRHQPQLLMFYTHIGDAANHLHWKADMIADDLFFPGFTHRDYRPGATVTRTNRMLDGFLGDVLSRVSPDATIAIVSDHGFGYRGYEHDNAPPGVLILRGPGIRPGVFTGADVSDVTPTLLHALGLAVADDMDGEVLAIVEPGGPLDRQVARVASFGPAASRDVRARGNDEEEMRRHERYLRQLGYVN